MINFFFHKKGESVLFSKTQKKFIKRSKEILFWTSYIKEAKLDFSDISDLKFFYQHYDSFFAPNGKIKKNFLKNPKNFNLLVKINQIPLSLFKNLIINDLNLYWNKIFVFLEKLLVFDVKKVKIKKICDFTLCFSKDINQDYQLKKSVFEKYLNFDNKNLKLLNLKKITISKIETFIQESLFEHLLICKKYFLLIGEMHLSFDHLEWWKKTFLHRLDFSLPDYQWKKKLQAEISDAPLEVFKIISVLKPQNLENLIIEEIKKYWETFSNQLKRVKDLSLLFANQQMWLKTGLNFKDDLDYNGSLKKEAFSKIINNHGKSWNAIKQINTKKIQHFIEEQIVSTWYQNRAFFYKLKILAPSFFKEQYWLNTSLNIDKLLNRENTKQKIINIFKILSDEQKKNFLKLDMIFLRKKIDLFLEKHWNKNISLIKKIIILDYQILESDRKWKKLDLKIDRDLKKDGTLLSLKNGDFDYWNWEKISIFYEIDVLYLENIFMKIVNKKSAYLQISLQKAKKNNVDLSKQNFWLKTNLNWQNDVNINGSLTKGCLASLKTKNLSQLEAFISLQNGKINQFIDFSLQSKKLHQNKVRFYVWKKFKNWFLFKRQKKWKSFAERLRTSFVLKSIMQIKRLESYSDFIKNEKAYQKLQRFYSQRIIREQEIIGIYDVNIHPIKYIIELKNVSKYFLIGRKINTVLDNINLKIRRGDFVVVLGPSGAGKSSLLNLISGIDNANVGDVFVNGYNLSLLNASGLTEFRRKYVGFIFQQYNLLSNLTARENVEISMALLPQFKEAIDLYQVFQFLKIDHLLEKYPFQLSGGEQQRFSIARALAKNPDILFCDEPTGALDQKMSKKVMKTLMEINVKFGTTIIIVTHNNEYIKIAKTIINFRDGKIVNHYRNARQIDPEKLK